MRSLRTRWALAPAECQTRRLIEHLKDDHESIMETLHADISATEGQHNDAVTSNLLQEISDKHHKMAWMLRMILQRSTLE